MGDYNKWVGVGRLTDDPEEVKEGMVKFSVAFKSGYGDREKTNFLPVICFKGTASAVQQYTVRGSEVLVEGELTSDDWEKDGVKRRNWTVFATKVVFFRGKEQGQNSGPTGSSSSGSTGNSGSTGQPDPLEDDDSDIPF